MNKHATYVALVLLAGCATTANYEAALQSWVGQPMANLVADWGPPQSSSGLDDGGQVLEYVDQRNKQMPGHTYTAPQTTLPGGTGAARDTSGSGYGSYSGASAAYAQHKTPGYTTVLSCKTRITVDSRGIITDWDWQGNNCKAARKSPAARPS